MFTSSLSWVNWSSLVFGLLETVAKVSQPNKALNQQSSELKFKRLSLYTYLALSDLLFSCCVEIARKDRHTNTCDDYRMLQGLCPPKHNKMDVHVHSNTQQTTLSIEPCQITSTHTQKIQILE